jgi:hypothetical protein
MLWVIVRKEMSNNLGDGKMVEQLSKAEYQKTKWWKDTQAWIKRIPQELDSKKGAKPLKTWKVFEADSWDAAWTAAEAAAWDATRTTAWTAARTTAWDAAGAAAWDAAGAAAEAAARTAAGAAAWAAARDTAWDAARTAAGDAAGDAALLARVKICAGLKLDAKHVKHAEERWEANKRCFRVWYDVDGVLYVYKKK